MQRVDSRDTLLSIAGYDSGNGAGVETDLKVFDFFGFHGAGAITAITAQNTTGVKGIYPVKAEELRHQIRTIVEDFHVSGIKTGMIYSADQVDVVLEEVDRLEAASHHVPLVVDPVIFAKDGTPLIKDVEHFKQLLRRALVVTPNAVEASLLMGGGKEVEDPVSACRELLNSFGSKYVVLKGGHIPGEKARDVLCWRGGHAEYILPRLENTDTHGTGSVFASALLSSYLKGSNMVNAVSEAKTVVYWGIKHGLHVGKGIGPIDPLVKMRKDFHKYHVLEEMREFAKFISEEKGFSKLIPEVQSNLAHSIPPNLVDGLEDIATYQGRIIKEWDGKVRVGFPAVFGNPTHTARLLNGLIKRGVLADSLINVRFDERLIRKLSDEGYSVVEIFRENEPSWGEERTMDWIAEISSKEKASVAFDRGVKGKEAMIRIWSLGIDGLIRTLKLLLSE
ncbi:bifunctional hydroxymethylpyrimidine kinase/phosphomethylpyrimidine kinase [Sulfuracidifex tepidarius]|uniref:Bifunctional thiamine biosynthesis protein ThiDN n=1 Tax=Sulfuracidifex tepidarius TaxID=1294262 RepID=A0A510E785_9CREN|nr:bifunctional hydroxymethylpyrimidine kinase/phosphomethylpyrimidine kinase [Sulfuracidifex tepidarius]BBG28030.1 Bifunctional thiamine biosynthesis protein ThiDN [Sulfuracidifex tepidarius]